MLARGPQGREPLAVARLAAAGRLERKVGRGARRRCRAGSGAIPACCTTGCAGAGSQRQRCRRARDPAAAARRCCGRPERGGREQQRAIRDGDRRPARSSCAYRLASAANQHAGRAVRRGEWLAGWLALRFTGQPKLARRHFERLWPVVATPISQGRAGYWAGRAAAARGDRQAAAGWYKRAAAHPQHVLRPARRRGAGPGDRRPRSPQRRSPPPPPARPCAGATPARLAAPVLPARTAGCGAALLPPSRLRGRRRPGRRCGPWSSSPASATAPDLVLAVTRAAAGNGTYLVRDAFPLPRLPAFRADRRRPARAGPGAGRGAPGEPVRPDRAQPRRCHGPDAADAGDRAGGRGELGLPFSEAAPDRRPRLQCPARRAAICARQLDRFDSEPALALAAYNAGPGRVAEWLEANGDPRGSGPVWAGRLDRADPVRRDPQLRPARARGAGMYRVVLAASRRQPAPNGIAAPTRRTPVRPRFDAEARHAARAWHARRDGRAAAASCRRSGAASSSPAGSRSLCGGTPTAGSSHDALDHARLAWPAAEHRCASAAEAAAASRLSRRVRRLAAMAGTWRPMAALAAALMLAASLRRPPSADRCPSSRSRLGSFSRRRGYAPRRQCGSARPDGTANGPALLERLGAPTPPCRPPLSGMSPGRAPRLPSGAR